MQRIFNLQHRAKVEEIINGKKIEKTYTVIDITDRMWDGVPKAYEPLIDIMGVDKINSLLLKDNKEEHFFREYDENGEAINTPFTLDVAFWTWITGRGIGKTWWPFAMAYYKSKVLGMHYNMGWLNKQVNDIPSSVLQGQKVLADLVAEYNIDYYSSVGTNTSMSGGYIRIYEGTAEEAKKTGQTYRNNSVLVDSFDNLDRLSKRNPTRHYIEDVFADEIVSHNQRELPPSLPEWKDHKSSIKASWLKFAEDGGLPNALWTFCNRWDERHPEITEAEAIMPYNIARSWFLEDAANNHIKFYYVLELKKIIVYATKFNALKIRSNPVLTEQLMVKLEKALNEDDRYQIAAILGESYEGHDSNDYTYRGSMSEPDKFRYGLASGRKEPLFVSVDIDPNHEFVVNITGGVWVGDKLHSNCYDTIYIPCNFKGRTPLKSEVNAIIEQIIDAIYLVQIEYGLLVQSMFVDDNFGFFISDLQDAIPNLFITKPIEKKDDFNILTRQRYFNQHINTRLHFADTVGNRRLIQEFWACKTDPNKLDKRDESSGVNMLNGINAWEYSNVMIQYSFISSIYQPIKESMI